MDEVWQLDAVADVLLALMLALLDGRLAPADVVDARDLMGELS